jgi:8-hydroxy-5-deazaflavin:NADPH oxidoreductase
MRVLVIGTGNMGRAISTRLLTGGQSVTLYNRTREEAEQVASELRSSATRGATVTVANAPEQAIQESDVVVLAVYYPINVQLATEHAARLAGKIVVDISNPLNATFDGLATKPGTSAAETVQAALPAGATVVKAFNTTFASTLLAGQVAGQPLDVFIAGDHGAAKEVVATLVRGGGLNPIDVGALERARQLEGLGFLGITLQGRLGTQFDTAWKLIVPTKR